MSDDGKKLSKVVDDPLSANRDPNKKEWVKFEEENDDADVLKSNVKVITFIQISKFYLFSQNSRSMIHHVLPSMESTILFLFISYFAVLSRKPIHH